MKTTIFISSILVGCLFMACNQNDFIPNAGNQVATNHRISIEQAKSNALNFVNKVNSTTRNGSTKTFEISDVQAISLTQNSTRSAGDSISLDTLLYIVNFADSAGFVIAGTDDREDPIYAYIEEGNYSWEDADTLNQGFIAFLYALLESKSYDYQRDVEIIPGESGGGGGGGIPNRFEVMSPLLVTKWSQNRPYNTYTPNGYTGCVVTAISQICSFLEAPADVHWSYNYTNGSATMNWGMIKTECIGNGGAPTSTADQVAHLMRSLGLAFGAEYESEGTGVDSDDAIEYMQNVGHNVSDLDDYDVNNVVNSLKSGNKIVYMRGYARYYHVGLVFRKYVDGHAWVVDGYINEVKNNKQSYYLHCNWGWGGIKNGYFLNNVFNAEQNPPYNDNAHTRGNNYQYNLETAIFTKQ